MVDMPYSRFHVHLTKDQLAAFGAFICVCSRLEVIASGLVHALCDFRDDYRKPGRVITTGMTLRGKLELAVKLAHTLAPKESDFPEKLSKFVNQDVSKLSTKRGDLAHASWGQYGNSETWPESVAVAEIFKKDPKGHKKVRHELKTADFEEAITEADRLLKSCLSFLREAERLHSERRNALQSTPQ